ncbi:hypothetical protein WKK05_22625 [Nostoc sp. UHCC 0302]|uniref:hypothetical protein n=1 Tax=Nostoc sp. UHCC 0302 TaxID=3134896 RepID=UPI00311CC388
MRSRSVSQRASPGGVPRLVPLRGSKLRTASPTGEASGVETPLTLEDSLTGSQSPAEGNPPAALIHRNALAH